MPRNSLATVPNLLSLSRLGMAGLFVLLKDTDARLLLIAAAGVTDFLDGYFARLYGSATKWGALIDPVADRFFLFAAVCSLLFEGVIDTREYALFMFRDVMTAIGFLSAKAIPSLRSVTFQARMAGKVVTVLQLAALAVVFLAPAFAMPVLLLLGAVSVYAVVDYTNALWNARSRA
jgi:CDP-diacylglycerol--glycerol-3-phosphate 3-phosphatidyltransferase/cardiolipin synthase